jgi:rod shape-determining protein MreD
LKFFYWCGFGLGLVVLQTSVAPVLSAFGTTPDLMLVAVVLVAIYWSGDDHLLFAAAMGYVKDLYSGGVTGVSLLVFFLVSFLVKEEKHRLDFENPTLFAGVVAGATFLEGYLLFFLQSAILAWEIAWVPVFLAILKKALYNLVLALAGMIILRAALERYRSAHSRKRHRELV